VIIHGLRDARLALALGRPVTLLSAPGAALYAGCGWWRAVVAAARAAAPTVPLADVLDCGDATGQALAALRIGQRALVLAPDAPGRAAVAAIAARDGVRLLARAPPALDLAACGAAGEAARRLHDWLHTGTTPRDSRPPLG
jgi:hypothetical protein